MGHLQLYAFTTHFPFFNLRLFLFLLIYSNINYNFHDKIFLSYSESLSFHASPDSNIYYLVHIHNLPQQSMLISTQPVHEPVPFLRFSTIPHVSPFMTLLPSVFPSPLTGGCPPLPSPICSSCCCCCLGGGAAARRRRRPPRPVRAGRAAAPPAFGRPACASGASASRSPHPPAGVGRDGPGGEHVEGHGD